MDTPQHPLIPASSAAAPPPARRIVFLAAVAILSVWANYEASKDFEIVVVNDVGLDTALGRRLSLLLVSDDSATRAVLRAARLSRSLLYSTDDPVKPVRRITVRLAAAAAAGGWNLTSRFADVVVERRPDDEYVVAVGVAGGEQWEKGEVVGAIERGVASVWVRDGGAPAAAAEGGGGRFWGVVRGGGGVHRTVEPGDERWVE